MSDPEIVIEQVSYPIPIQLLGLDEQGRQLYRCPTVGCGETAYFDEEGRGHCPVDEAIRERLRKGWERLAADLDAKFGGAA